MSDLETRIRDRTARICVIGLGYVGLPLAGELARAGFHTTGLEVNECRAEAIRAGRSYIGDVRAEDVAALVDAGRLTATTDYGVLDDADVVFICVPTPFTENKAPDLSYIVSAATGIAEHLHPGMLIVLQSTTHPGTTEEDVLPILERTGLRAGVDFHLAFSPERINPGDKAFGVHNTPKVVGGLTPRCGELTALVFQQIMPAVHIISSPRAAEMSKLLENIFRSVNIALVNELALLSERMGIDIWEVIEAAKTKPFGFMPFYPGPGVGGHCLAPGEHLVIKDDTGVQVVPIGDYIDQVRSQGQCVVSHVDGVTLVQPRGVQVLAFHPGEGKAHFQPLHCLSARRYEGQMLQVWMQDGRRLTVTDGHPMVVRAKGQTRIKRAADLEPGDRAVVFKAIADEPVPLPPIDLIAHLAPDDCKDVRVRPRRESLATYREQLVPHLRSRLKYYWDVFRYNTMPLRVFVALERAGVMPIPREDVLLCTGRGSSYNSIPAVFPITEDLARLIGYYLSEGCLTEDESLRTRFTFHSDERETIADLEAILTRLGLKFSAYQDRQWQSYHIKVSSRLFGALLRDVLGCGTDSYTMSIPACLLFAPENLRLALLSGLLRGDGDVHHTQEQRTYTKWGRQYTHAINTATVGYFSASPTLFRQVVFLLHSLGFVPTFKRDKPHLRLYGADQLERLSAFLVDEKRRRLDAFKAGRRKRMPRTQSRDHGDFATVQVRKVRPVDPVDVVYSLETTNPHLFVTSYGLVVHNCIPVDPYYLSWKAREYDFYTKFIELAAETNQRMAYHVVELITQALNRRGVCLTDAHILVLGVAFKPDVDDARNSTAQRVIELLLDRGAHVQYNDPYVPQYRVGPDAFHKPATVLESVPLTEETVAWADCVLILANHSSYDYAWLVRQARLIVDTRNATQGVPGRHNVIRIGAPFSSPTSNL